MSKRFAISNSSSRPCQRSCAKLPAVILALCVAACSRDEPASEQSGDPSPRRRFGHVHELNRDGGGPEVLPPATDEQIRGLEAAIAATADTDADMRHVSALTGLAIASRGRIPAQLADDLLAYVRATNRERARTLLAVFDNSAWLFDEVCGQPFESLFAEAQSTRDRGASAAHVWRECKLDRVGLLAGEDEFVAASKSVGPEPMLAYFIAAYLNAHGGAHPHETALLRTIAAGIPADAQLPGELQDWLADH